MREHRDTGAGREFALDYPVAQLVDDLLVQRPALEAGIAIETPAAPAQARFLQQWPEGSDAHASYFSRIAAGPAYREADVIRWET